MTKDTVASLPGRARRCPICGRPALPQYRPFCSPRCADVDLGRWFQGDYRIATDDAPEEGSAADEEP
jgi:uncharacterized protein